ncbi:adhesion G protein-coupled receptor E3-like [Xyrauchen texanus]|uniref:adhesion G protein-coupled receptor E3-like n=1 Tax=Xyrauchen texanus TaxID=154827 RepID=UPI0022421899|nr:adhesion G protein-coupled receptor E3-like [Xyrauchen texanus]
MAAVSDYLFFDPCYNYTELDDTWRSTDNTNNTLMCDWNVNWVGWYRLFIQGSNAKMPDTCIANSRCGTDFPLWLRDGHPTVGDGEVSRDVCSHAGSDCCYYQSKSITVKACPDNYYVYEFVTPAFCNSAYCAVFMIHSVIPGFISTASSIIPNITLPEECKIQITEECVDNLLNQIENITAEVLPLNVVTDILGLVLNTSEKIPSLMPNELAYYGNRVLKASEKLISTLVKPTDTSDSVNFTLKTVEAKVFMVGPNVTLNKIPRLDTTSASVDIDLIGIAQNNQETTAVAFMSFTTMENLLRPDFFNTSDDSVKTMMSTVISATLPKTVNTKLTKPVNFTLKHIREFVSRGNLSCVYWNISEWIVDGCSVVKTNSNHTVCSCDHLSTFALIMQTSRPPEDDPLMEILNLVAVIVGLVFLSLTLLTFAFCRWNPGVNNVARINLCLSLLLAHLLFLLTQQFLNYIRPNHVLCAVISGVLHFLFLSSFVWMFIEAVLIFICVKNLSQISSNQREVLSSRFMIVIGYVIAFVVVGVSAGLVPEGYGSEKCWIKSEKGFIWSFLGPVCVVLALNVILFISIIVSLNSTLTKLNAGVSQMKQTKTLVFKTLSQFVVLGCPWILGFFTNKNEVVEIIFLCLNSQQGTFIFIIYCVLNNEIRQQYVDWLNTIFPGPESRAIKSAPQNS